jgi:hypothetical protein
MISVDDYLAASYTDGDREYLDGVVVERSGGTPGHSALQKILVVYLTGFEKSFQVAVRPECRARIAETRYRVPDVLLMERPFPPNRQGCARSSIADCGDIVARR